MVQSVILLQTESFMLLAKQWRKDKTKIWRKNGSQKEKENGL